MDEQCLGDKYYKNTKWKNIGCQIVFKILNQHQKYMFTLLQQIFAYIFGSNMQY